MITAITEQLRGMGTRQRVAPPALIAAYPRRSARHLLRRRLARRSINGRQGAR